MKPLIVLTLLSLALAACGKDDKPAGERASAARAAQATPSAPAVLPNPASAEDKAASGAAPSKPASSARRAARDARSHIAAAAASAPSGTTHTVAQGDTLASVAKSRGVKAADVARWNNIRDPRRLRIGQELRLTPP